jgi:hypothetical protein
MKSEESDAVMEKCFVTAAADREVSSWIHESRSPTVTVQLPSQVHVTYAPSIDRKGPAALGAAQSSVQAKLVTGKREYLCRVCTLPLSSSSNRARHERLKHKGATNLRPSMVAKPAKEDLVPVASKPHAEFVDVPGRLQEFQPPPTLPMECGATATRESAAVNVNDPCLQISASQEKDNWKFTGLGAGMDAIEEQGPVRLDIESDPDEMQQPTEYGSGEEDPDATVQVQSEGLQNDITMFDGYEAPLTEDQLQAACYPFLVWLSQPPLMQCEALVKVRRVRAQSQLLPIKSNLRFLFTLLHQGKHVRAVQLEDLGKLTVCQSLSDALSNRGAGSARIHALFLLVKKILVFLCSQESNRRKQFLQPTMHESYLYVDGICADSGLRRKQEARNRAVLGVHSAQLLSKQQAAHAPPAFEIPKLWSDATSSSAPSPVAVVRQLIPSVIATAAAAPGPAVSSANELTKDELRTIAQGCMSFLNAAIESDGTATVPAAAASSSRSVSASAAVVRAASDRMFMAYLATATLCLGLAPRSQILAQLQIGSSFTKEIATGRYCVKILAEMSKNGKPTMFTLPTQLSPAFDYFLQVVRPRLLSAPTAGGPHEYVFVKSNGAAPRSDFSSCTSTVSLQLIGRCVNAHAFRSAVITAFYEAGASQSEMDTLASIMAHDTTTARAFYFRPKFAAAAAESGQRMLECLGLSAK